MPHRVTHSQLVARDAKGRQHVIRVTRQSIPGSPHLHGAPHYSWNDVEQLHLVDAKAGVLESAVTGERLTLEDWRG